MSVYYKIIRVGKELSVACLQDFDEPDYDQSRFLSPFKYPTEEEAQAVINGIKLYMADRVMAALDNLHLIASVPRHRGPLI